MPSSAASSQEPSSDPGPGQTIIGVDVGTTGVKAVAFRLGSPWRTLAVRQYHRLRPAPGQEAQDPTTTSGRSLPFLTWADGRASPETAHLARQPAALDLQQTAGTPVHPMTPMAKLVWFRRHDPTTWKAGPPWV